MNTKFASFCFMIAVVFSSCQSNSNSENPEEILEEQNSLKEKKHDVNKWHDGPYGLEGDSGMRLHQAGYFQGALANCDTYGHYEGGENLTVLTDSPQSYHGEVDVTNIIVNDQLNICGTLNVYNEVKVNHGAIFNLGGEMFSEGNVTVNNNGHMVIEGNVTIEGDFILNRGALLRFLGDNSSITVLGDARIHKETIIEGQFDDVSGKIK